MPVDPKKLAKLREDREWLTENATTDEERAAAETMGKIERWVSSSNDEPEPPAGR